MDMENIKNIYTLFIRRMHNVIDTQYQFHPSKKRGMITKIYIKMRDYLYDGISENNNDTLHNKFYILLMNDYDESLDDNYFDDLYKNEFIIDMSYYIDTESTFEHQSRICFINEKNEQMIITQKESILYETRCMSLCYYLCDKNPSQFDEISNIMSHIFITTDYDIYEYLVKKNIIIPYKYHFLFSLYHIYDHFMKNHLYYDQCRIIYNVIKLEEEILLF